MFSLAASLFVAGLVTILLPCILPLVPIVLGVSIADKDRKRPLIIIAGMLVSFVGFTFLLQVVLSQFVEVADYIRISTYDVLWLFGLGFLFHRRDVPLIGAALGGLFFWDKGWIAVIIAGIAGVIAMDLGGRVAGKLQQLGGDLQQGARSRFGSNASLTAFVIGLTMGLVWVPCAGPALGFALGLVRDQPGLQAFFYLSMYGIGAAVPLLLIGYGGQAAVRSVRALSQYSGVIKQVSGVLLLLCAIAFRFDFSTKFQTWVANNTSYGAWGTAIEERLFRQGSASSTSPASVSSLPKLSRAPELTGLGTWHNSQPLTLASLKGKVVLIDFWTYSCINCIRTLPYIEGYWEKYRDKPFVIVGVHTPEFTFEKSDSNVAMAIKEHSLTYPIAQDNDFGTWNAFANHYWPAKYLIDADGYIRYTHFGEGNYDETDKAIGALLAEKGIDTSSMPVASEPGQSGSSGPVSPETYLHSRSWPAFGNSLGDPDASIHAYKAPATMELNKFYLDGSWQLVDDEQQVLRSDSGQIGFRAQAGEVNLVLGLEEGAAPVAAEVWVDGKKTKTFTIQNHDLYTLFKGDYGEHDVVLKLMGKGVEGYAYTFGG